MALCVYHETTEAVATCPVCKQGICDKCLEYGQDGMCGMCVEIAAARKATAETNRAARQAAATAAGAAGSAPAGAAPTPARPANAAPARPAGRPPAPANGTNGRGSGPLPAPPKPAARPGMCAEHPDQAAKASCAHCHKKVCPYCLDLYDLCTECRQLPHCVRHESMVGADRCAGCKMNFCKICLDGTDYCDRCRTLRAASGQPVKKSPTGAPAAKGGTGPQKPANGSAAKPGTGPKSPTGSLQRTPTGALNPKVAPPPPGARAEAGATVEKTAVSTRQAAARMGTAALAKKGGGGKPPWPVIGAGALVFLLVVWKMFFGGKPSLGPDEAIAALKAEMGMVQKAAATIAARDGSYPSTSAAIIEEMKKEGVNPDDLPLPFKLSVGTQPTEPLAIGYTKVGESFEIRALDNDGRPLADNGRDVILRPPPSRKKQDDS